MSEVGFKVGEDTIEVQVPDDEVDVALNILGND